MNDPEPSQFGLPPTEGLMAPEASTVSNPYHSRTYRLNAPRNRWIRWGRRIADRVEGHLARVSRVGDHPVFSHEHFPWLRSVETDWRRVRAELDEILQFRDHIPSFQDILKEVGTIQSDDQWKTFFLTGIGMDCRENARRCPATVDLLSRIPGVKTAFFSILSPGKHIPPHRGPFVGVLRLHLALVVPEPAEKCRIRIADQILHWSEGRCLIFDDTYNHEVWNETNASRVVLFVDFERPLPFPYSLFNRALLNLAALAPFLREANARQAQWSRKFPASRSGPLPS